MSVQLTVLGLNRVGVSVGLALKSNSEQITRIGSDTSVGTEQKALKMGAFDKVVHNIPAAVEEADIVVLCVPMDEVRKNLETIAPVLKPGAVVLDTSPLAAIVTSWTENLFSDECFLISFTPSFNPDQIVNGGNSIEQASANLFQNSLIAISVSPSVHPDAIKLASDLATLLGAHPYFSDPYEVDGLFALADLLPALSSAALLRAVASQASWREARKLAGHAFYTATEPANHFEGKDLGKTVLLNSENTIRVLDYLIEELRALQELLKNQDDDELKKALDDAVDFRAKWWQARQKAEWEKQFETPPLPTSGQMIGKLFGLNRFLKNTPPTKK